VQVLWKVVSLAFFFWLLCLLPDRIQRGRLIGIWLGFDWRGFQFGLPVPERVV
jgi:hypothetical protein